MTSLTYILLELVKYAVIVACRVSPINAKNMFFIAETVKLIIVILAVILLGNGVKETEVNVPQQNQQVEVQQSGL